MAKNEARNGAILSYILIILNGCYGLFLTPYIIGFVGDEAYGVFKTISSFTSAFMVLDLGLGGTMMRYIAKFKADKNESEIPNFIAMGLLQAAAIATVLGALLCGFYFGIDYIYQNGLNPTEISKAKELYLVLGLGMLAHIFENVSNGIICGHNKFTIANGVKVLRLVIRIISVLFFLSLFKDTLVLVVVDTALTFLLLIIEWIYICFKQRIKIRLERWDNAIFKSSFKYTILMLITSIAAQINSNLDNVVIGAFIGSGAVAIYSIALLIFGIFEQLSTAISGVMLPMVTNVLKEDDANSKIQELIVQVGRIQFMLLGAALVGFSVLGRTFLSIWIGEGFDDVYFLTLILMVPSILELCVNICLSVLKANNDLIFRTMVLLGTMIGNAIITVVGVYFLGYYMAAVGTALSFFIGSVVIMGVYYKKKYGFNMLSIYGKIFKNIWLCLLLSGIVCFGSTFFIKILWVKLLVGVISFLICYVGSLFLFGLNKEEKLYIKNTVKRRSK